MTDGVIGDGLRPASILLVDDEPANLVALEAVLAPLGQRLVKAASGREALRHVLREEFAAILLDVRMPVMDGFETAEIIRSRTATRSTPILFVTAFPEAERDLPQAYRIGAADVIFRPFVPEFLRTKLRAFIELHLQQRSIRELLARAEESSRAKSEFLKMAAHELRTPLAVVVGYLSMLADGTFGELTEDLRRVVDILNEKGQDLNRIVDDVLTASRLQGGPVAARMVDCDLREVARQAVRRAAARARLQEAVVELDVASTPVIVTADPGHLGRIVDNLIVNALTYSRGRPWVRVAVPAVEPALLTVEDNGIGIPPDMRERVFEQFFRLERPGEVLPPGTGLGLYISRELARRHAAEVHVLDSEVGRGSTLALRLARAPA